MIFYIVCNINLTLCFLASTEMLDKLLKICTTSIPGFDSGSTRGAIVALCLRAQAPVFLLLLNWAPKNLTCSELLGNCPTNVSIFACINII